MANISYQRSRVIGISLFIISSWRHSKDLTIILYEPTRYEIRAYEILAYEVRAYDVLCICWYFLHKSLWFIFFLFYIAWDLILSYQLVNHNPFFITLQPDWIISTHTVTLNMHHQDQSHSLGKILIGWRVGRFGPPSTRSEFCHGYNEWWYYIWMFVLFVFYTSISVPQR